MVLRMSRTRTRLGAVRSAAMKLFPRVLAVTFTLGITACAQPHPVGVDGAARLAYRAALDTCLQARSRASEVAAAIKACSAAIGSSLASSDDLGQAKKARAALNYDDGLYGAAILDYAELVRQYPTNFRIRKSLGDAYLRQGQCDTAVANYNRALRLNSDYAEAFDARGDGWLCLHNYGNAVSDYAQAIRLQPRRAKTYAKRAAAYSELGEKKMAIDDYTLAIGLRPREIASYISRRALLLAEEHHEPAPLDNSATVQPERDDADTLYHSGLDHFGHQEYESAIEDFDRALQNDHNFAKALDARANAYMREGQNDLAIQDYSRAVEITPEFSEAFAHRGDVYSQTGDYARAIQDYTKALRLDPSLLHALVSRGNAHVNRGEYELAIADYKEALRLDLSDATAARKLKHAKSEKEKQDTTRSMSIESNVTSSPSDIP